MAVSIGMTRINPMPTGKLPAAIGPLARPYSSKASAIWGYFFTFSLLLTIISMTPGTQESCQYLSTPSISLTKLTPAMERSHSSLLASSSGLPQSAATSAAERGSRKAKCIATSAMSSVTTGARILYSGSFSFTAFLAVIFLLLILLAKANTFCLAIFSHPPIALPAG